jgi:hypothetical protein
MTILLWSEPHHAGFLSTSNNFEFMIPQDSQNGEAHIWATVTQVLHDSVYVRGRGTRVSRLKCGVLKAESPVALVPTAQTGVLRRQSPRLQTKPPTQSTSFNPAKTAGSRKARTYYYHIFPGAIFIETSAYIPPLQVQLRSQVDPPKRVHRWARNSRHWERGHSEKLVAS